MDDVGFNLQSPLAEGRELKYDKRPVRGIAFCVAEGRELKSSRCALRNGNNAVAPRGGA